MNKKFIIQKSILIVFMMTFICSGFLSPVAIAAQDTWETVTPSGFSGTVNKVASFGDYVYVGTSQGVYKSVDRGDNWTQMNTGLTNLNVTAIAIGWVLDQETFEYIGDSNTDVYVATSGGIFKSTLGGNTWSAVNNGLAQTNIIDLTIDQFNAGYGSASSLYAVATGAGNIYRSDDGGDSWSLQNTGIAGENIKAIITESTSDYVSGNILAITVSNKVYASTVFSADSATDESWTEKYTASGVLNEIEVLNPFPGSEFLATAGGILRSDDAGDNWNAKNTGVDDLRINSIASDYLDATILYAGGYDGVYKSVNGDGAASWTKANLGIGSVNVKKIVTNPTTSTLVYAVTDNAVFRLDLSDSGIIPVASDFTAPAAIDDLSGNGVTANSVGLNWSAPGDDGSTGTATAYDIRYSNNSIDESNWDQTTPLSGEPAPQVAGTLQNMTVTGLTPNTQYYFAMKTADEASNISPISTILGVHTTPASVGLGDVDNSGTINTADALLTLRNSVGLSMTSTAWQVGANTGDVNCDGTSNSADALLILRYSVGLVMGSTAWCVV